MKFKTRILSVILSGLIVVSPVPALASGAIAGSTELTQIANNVELVQSYLMQAQQYANQIQQYQNLVQNTLNIPNQIWSDVQGDLMGIMNVVRQGQGLAFSMQNIGEQFKIKYPGFKPSTDFLTDYKSWSTTLMDTIKGSLQAANLQADQFTSEENVLQQLRGMSSSNQGRLQAIQTGNQIALETVTQMQKLRALTMSQMQAQNAFMASEQQQKDTETANLQEFFTPSKLEESRSYQNY